MRAVLVENGCAEVFNVSATAQGRCGVRGLVQSPVRVVNASGSGLVQLQMSLDPSDVVKLMFKGKDASPQGAVTELSLIYT